jgi:hypothetical protein
MIGDALADIAAFEVAAQGTPTRIKGQVVNAIWTRAQPGRVQMFLGETLEGVAVYEVGLPASVLKAPICLRIADEMTWISTGWNGVVRGLDASDATGTVTEVSAIVEILSQ